MHPILRTTLRIALPLLVLVLGALGAWKLIESREIPESTPPARIVPTVEVVQAVADDLQLTVTAQGTVRPATESELVAEVSGRVVEVDRALNPGSFFAGDDPLVTIDPRDYELAIVDARSQVAQTELRLALEEAEAESAVREWHSLQRPGDPPDLVARVPQLKEARAAVEAAKARQESARRDRDRCVITAPYDGRTLEKYVDLGQFVQRGTRLARIYATDRAEVRLPLRLADLAFLDMNIDRSNGEFLNAHGPLVTLRGSLAGEVREWQGRIVRTEGQLDPRSRMIHVIVRVDDPYLSNDSGGSPLLVGMFVEAEIEGRHVEDCVALPRHALFGESQILLVDDEDRLRIRDVEVLRASRDRALIRTGLEPGERVCVTRLDIVSDGMQVRVAKPEGEEQR